MDPKDLPVRDGVWDLSDWHQALGDVKDDSYAEYPNGPGIVNSPGAVLWPGIDQVVAVRAMITPVEADYGETEVHAVFEFEDGTWGYLDAGCDTTGWGCQDDSRMWLASTPSELAMLIPEQTLGWMAAESGTVHGDGYRAMVTVVQATPELQREPSAPR